VAQVAIESPVKGKTYWRCLCDCGATHDVRTDTFVFGQVLACAACDAQPEPVLLSLHYHERRTETVLIGYAGFVVANRSDVQLCVSPWLTATDHGQRKLPFAYVAAAWVAGQGHLRCLANQAAVRGWLRRHADQVALHPYPNEAAVRAVFASYAPI